MSSSFLGHATAQDLMASFHEKCAGLDMKNAIQLSMDGPPVNWCFYDLLNSELKEEHSVNFLNTESCGIHKVHNCFKEAFERSPWNLQSSLKAFHTIFNNPPVRHEDYFVSTGCSNSPLPLHF